MPGVVRASARRTAISERMVSTSSRAAAASARSERALRIEMRSASAPSQDFGASTARVATANAFSASFLASAIIASCWSAARPKRPARAEGGSAFSIASASSSWPRFTRSRMPLNLLGARHVAKDANGYDGEKYARASGVQTVGFTSCWRRPTRPQRIRRPPRARIRPPQRRAGWVAGFARAMCDGLAVRGGDSKGKGAVGASPNRMSREAKGATRNVRTAARLTLPESRYLRPVPASPASQLFMTYHPRRNEIPLRERVGLAPIAARYRARRQARVTLTPFASKTNPPARVHPALCGGALTSPALRFCYQSIALSWITIVCE